MWIKNWFARTKICEEVIRYAAYSSDEEEKLLDFF
jgi:hypothetical protein